METKGFEEALAKTKEFLGQGKIVLGELGSILEANKDSIPDEYKSMISGIENKSAKELDKLMDELNKLNA